MSRAKIRKLYHILAMMGLFPLLFYFASFFILTYPAMTQFSTHLFADKWDGLQSAWDLWWVKKAVAELHQSPWHTNYLHWPYGISLLGHTLNPLNGFATMFLPPSIPLVERYNFVAILSFVVGGLTAFLLAHHLTKSFWGSVIGGFLFTFSSFHFAHLEGHLQVMSLEWIPLFILLWFELVSKPTIPVGASAAVVLFLVILCDYYFFFYCVLTGLIIFCWRLIREKGVPFFMERRYLIPLGVFCLISLGTSGMLAGAFLLGNLRDPFLGAHLAREFSLDLFAPFIYGGHWRFASLTKPYWSQLPGNIQESSVHLGLAVVILLVYVWRKRKLVQMRGIELWFFLLFFFAILALGPTLHIWGRERIAWLPLPYVWLKAVFPPLRVSGCPVRMMVITVLAAAVISAEGFKLLFRGPYRNRVFASLLLGLVLLEHFPRPITTSELSIPPYVSVLRELPEDGGVLDTVNSPPLAMLYQTVHGKPLAFGYVARVPRSVDAKDHELAEAIRSEAFSSIWPDYCIQYLLTAYVPDGLRNSRGVIWSDGSAWIFDLTAMSRPGTKCTPDNSHFTFRETAATQPLPDSAFKAQLKVVGQSSKWAAGSETTLRVKVRNISNIYWPALGADDGSYQVLLGDHWLNREGRTVVNDDVRVALPRDLGPDEEVELPLTVTVPKGPGGYLLELDMVQERVAWFKERGSQTVVIVAGPQPKAN